MRSVEPEAIESPPLITSLSATVGVISNSDTDPLAIETLPVTVIIPGEAPGLSVPAIAILPITDPADPKVAPERTAICAARIVDLAKPTSRPPDISTLFTYASPAIVA